MRFTRGHPLGSKEAMAEWMGYASVEDMDAEHDALHETMARLFAVASHSLAMRDGREHDARLAALEEDAVLFTQRWLQHLRRKNEERP